MQRKQNSRQEKRPFSALVQLRPDLLSAIKIIADNEQRQVGTVVNELVAFALEQHQSAEDSLEVWHNLTPREREVTAYIWLGLTNPQIAETLSISPNTVKTHIKNLLAKFHVNSKLELRHQLVSVDFTEWLETVRSPEGINVNGGKL